RVYSEFDEIALHPYHRAPPLGQVLDDLLHSAIFVTIDAPPAEAGYFFRIGDTEDLPTASSISCSRLWAPRSGLSQPAASPSNTGARRSSSSRGNEQQCSKPARLVISAGMKIMSPRSQRHRSMSGARSDTPQLVR